MEKYTSLMERLPLEHTLRDVMRQGKGELEYEVRLGYMKESRFSPGLLKNDFRKIQKVLEERYGKSEENAEVVFYFEDGTRSVRNEQTKKVKIYKKEKIRNFDFSIKDITFRAEVSLETILDESLTSRVSLVKNRISTSYKDARGFIFDLRESLPDGPYEIEIEFNNDFVRNALLDKKITIFPPLYELLEIIGSSSFLPLTSMIRNNVLNSYHSIMRDRGAYFDKFRNEFKIKKPVNLPKNELESLGNYYVMPKLDGIRYFLFFDGVMKCSYLISDTEVFAYRFFNDDIFTNCILDGELYENEFYVFDVLNFPKKGLMFFNLKRMYDTIFRFDLIKKSFSDVDFLKIVPYYSNTIDAILNLVSFYDYKTDGLIFVPKSGLYYSPNYKYKPPKELTIDFVVKKNDQTNKFVLNVSSQENKLIPFKGDNVVPFIGEIDEENIKDGKVYEMKWDYKKNTFKIVRERSDKLKPNFVKVTENIWKDIMDPITVKTLVDSTNSTKIAMNVLLCFANVYFENVKPTDVVNYFEDSSCKYINYKNQKAVAIEKYVYYLENNEVKQEKLEKDEIIIDESFELSSIKWKKGEFLKQAYVKNYPVLIDKEGYLIIEGDDGETNRVYYKDFLDQVEGYKYEELAPLENTTDIYYNYLYFVSNIKSKSEKKQQKMLSKFIDTVMTDFDPPVLFKSKYMTRYLLAILKQKMYVEHDDVMKTMTPNEKVIFETILLVFNPEKYEDLTKSVLGFPFTMKDAMKALVDNMIVTINNTLEECIEILNIRPYLIVHMRNIIIKLVNDSFTKLYNQMKRSIRDFSLTEDNLIFKAIILSETYETNMEVYINENLVFANEYQKQENVRFKLEANKIISSMKVKN